VLCCVVVFFVVLCCLMFFVFSVLLSCMVLNFEWKMFPVMGEGIKNRL